MSSKKLLLGDEAVALGALHAGLSGVYAYPGTPSTEITEFIQNNPLAKQRGIHSRWCTNEKTAMEAALGMSYSGKRALVCMKHVGMNVCADAFVNSAITGVKGGLVVLAADDPSMHSSQNEQDSRFYGKFAMVPIFEPSDQQEAYDLVETAFSLSEKVGLPVMFRIVTRLAHSRAAVTIKDKARECNEFNPDNGKNWILLPAIARKQYLVLLSKQEEIEKSAEVSSCNSLEIIDGKGLGIVVCGIARNYVKEAAPKGISAILKISQYPLPVKKILKLAEISDGILVVEDGQPFVEERIPAILGAGYPVYGRLSGRLPRTGELNPDNVAAALGVSREITFKAADNVVGRPPALCQGCGHRDVYKALNEVAADYSGARIFGDIGCYTLGALPPFRSLSSCVDMGASITMAKGAADAGQFPSIAVIGDSTFTHSGMTGLLDAVNDKSNITVVISDNLTTAMTGGQDSAGTNKFEQICRGLGVEPEHIRVVIPLPKNMAEITKVIREEISYCGVSVIIPRRECVQVASRKARKKLCDKK
ncbi:MAG: indolepyruvate ferredoxin oxidoreductase subunit alpha [Bacteroidales bacterium]